MPTLILNPSEASSSPSVLSSQDLASPGTSSALYYHPRTWHPQEPHLFFIIIQVTASPGTSSALYYQPRTRHPQKPHLLCIIPGHGIPRNLINSVLSSRSRQLQEPHVTDLESTPCLDAKSAFTTEGIRELLSQIQVTMTWEHRIRLPAITCYNRCLEALKATEDGPLSPVEFSFSLVWRHDLFQRQECFILLSPPLGVHPTGPVSHLTKRPPLRKADFPEAKLR